MTINTPRLTIRLSEEDDWESLLEVFKDFENSEYKNYDFPLPTEEAAVKELAARWSEEKKYFAIVLAETGDMVGYLCYHGTDVPDIGYALKKRYQKKGYAYEAAKAWITQSEFECFTAGVAFGNTPSVALLEKLGFRLVKTESMSFRKDHNGADIVCDCGIYEFRK